MMTPSKSFTDITTQADCDQFPRDIETAVLVSLPACIVKVGRLSVDVVHEELRRRNIAIQCPVGNRALRGCLVAQADRGLIFVDGEDPPYELRFTVAHEAAHFIVDYLEPRAEAIAHFGDSIRAVLDHWREPTPEENVDAFLGRVPLRAHVHLMARDGWGDHLHCESRADDLAYEMLAPERHVRKAVAATPDIRDAREAATEILGSKFGLPGGACTDYAKRLYPRRPLTPLKKLLGF